LPRALYHNGNQFRIMFITNKLNQMKMSKIEVLKEYSKKVKELKNWLVVLEKQVLDCTLIQIVLNGQLKSYKYMIPIITHNSIFPTFNKMSAILCYLTNEKIVALLPAPNKWKDTINIIFQRGQLRFLQVEERTHPIRTKGTIY